MENLEFYRNIAKKDCEKCGHPMEEQAECYGNVCDSCLPVLTGK